MYIRQGEDYVGRASKSRLYARPVSFGSPCPVDLLKATLKKGGGATHPITREAAKQGRISFPTFATRNRGYREIKKSRSRHSKDTEAKFNITPRLSSSFYRQPHFSLRRRERTTLVACHLLLQLTRGRCVACRLRRHLPSRPPTRDYRAADGQTDRPAAVRAARLYLTSPGG